MAQDISISISDAFESAAAVEASQPRLLRPDDTAVTIAGTGVLEPLPSSKLGEQLTKAT